MENRIVKERRLKVLFNSFQSNRSGAPRLLHHIVSHIDREHFEPYIVFANDGPIVQEFVRIAPTFVIQEQQARILPFPMRWRVQQYVRERKLKKIIDRISPDVIYLNTTGQNYASDWLLKAEQPKIVHFHEIDNEVMRLNDNWLRRLVLNIDENIVCSKAVSQFVVQCLGVEESKVHTVYGAVPVLDILHNAESIRASEVKQALGLASAAILIGAVGKPSFRKGVDLFVQASAIVHATRPDLDIHFMWVGGHDKIHKQLYMESMRRLVMSGGLSGRFHWIQEVDNPIQYQVCMDACIIPSREDPFPLAMLESMLVGTPVIGFAVNGVSEALDDGRGVLVQSVNAEELAQSILNFLSEPHLWGEYSQKAKDFVMLNCDISRNVKRIEELLSVLV